MNTRLIKSKLKLPKIKGKIDIYPEILEGSIVQIVIIGDKKGLMSFSKFINTLATFDQNKNNDAIGTREHVHLHANFQLGSHSCEVEICRADAKGTGELPDFMQEKKSVE